jgi:hypothetical protein
MSPLSFLERLRQNRKDRAQEEPHARFSLLLLQSMGRTSPVVPTPTVRSSTATDNYPCC